MLVQALRSLPLAFSLIAATYAAADSKDWNARSLPLPKQCQDQAPDVGFELSPNYRPENALMALWAASLAEKSNREEIKAGLQAWGFATSYLFERRRTGVFAYIAEDPEFHLLSIPGTHGFLEIFRDAKFFPRSFELIGFSGGGHSGMLAQFQDVIKATKPFLERIDPLHSKPLLISGHSLGGSVALMHALHFVKEGWNILGVYTSGQPHLGNSIFNREVAQWLGDRYYRLEAMDDVVAKVPPVAESAAYFARIIPDHLGKAQDKIEALVSELNYSVPFGPALRLGQEIQLDYDTSARADLNYWDSLRNSVTGATSLDDVIQVLQRRIDSHVADNYICSFIRAYRRSNPEA